MVAVLAVIALLAFGNAVLGIFDLIQTWRPGATVFQQISARLDVGISILVTATAGGLAAMLKEVESQTRAITAGFASLRESMAAQMPVPAALPSSSEAGAAPAGPGLGVHRGVPFHRDGGEYLASVNGKHIRAATQDLLKLRISKALGEQESA